MICGARAARQSFEDLKPVISAPKLQAIEYQAALQSVRQITQEDLNMAGIFAHSVLGLQNLTKNMVEEITLFCSSHTARYLRGREQPCRCPRVSSISTFKDIHRLKKLKAAKDSQIRVLWCNLNDKDNKIMGLRSANSADLKDHQGKTGLAEHICRKLLNLLEIEFLLFFRL